jgi:hypothetical protein
MRTIGILLVFAFTGYRASAQRPEVGIFVGYPITPTFIVQDMPYFNNSYSCGPGYAGQMCGLFESAGRRPLLGISVFVPLTGRIALRASPAYQRISMSSEMVTPLASPAGFETDSFVTTADRWELPLSVRWRFTSHVNAGLGGTVSTVTGGGTQQTIMLPAGALGYGSGSTTYIYRENFLNNRTIGGATAGVEFLFHTRIGIIAPEVEYIRWASRHYSRVWPLDQLTVGIALRF